MKNKREGTRVKRKNKDAVQPGDTARHSPVSLLDQGANYKHCWSPNSQETFHPASSPEETSILQAPFSNKQLQTPQHFPGVLLLNSVFCPNSNFNSYFLSSRFPCLTLISLSQLVCNGTVYLHVLLQQGIHPLGEAWAILQIKFIMLGTFSNFALILPDAMLCSNRGVLLLLPSKKPMGAKGAPHLALGGIRRHTDCSAQVLRDSLTAQGLLVFAGK